MHCRNNRQLSTVRNKSIGRTASSFIISIIKSKIKRAKIFHKFYENRIDIFNGFNFFIAFFLWNEYEILQRQRLQSQLYTWYSSLLNKWVRASRSRVNKVLSIQFSFFFIASSLPFHQSVMIEWVKTKRRRNSTRVGIPSTCCLNWIFVVQKKITFFFLECFAWWWARLLFRSSGCILMKFKHGRKMFDSTSSNCKVLNCFYFKHFTTYNNDHQRSAIISLRFLSVDDTNAIRIVQQNDAYLNCSREWNQWNVHPFSNTSLHECVERERAESRSCYSIFCFKRRENKMNEREPVARDWMQKVVGFYSRWCWMSSRQK